MAYHVCLSHVGFSRIYFMLEESFLFLIEYFFVFSSDQLWSSSLYSRNVFSSTDTHGRRLQCAARPHLVPNGNSLASAQSWNQETTPFVWNGTDLHRPEHQLTERANGEPSSLMPG